MNTIISCTILLLNASLVLGLSYIYLTDRCSYWPDLLLIVFFLLNAYYSYNYIILMT